MLVSILVFFITNVNPPFFLAPKRCPFAYFQIRFIRMIHVLEMKRLNQKEQDTPGLGFKTSSINRSFLQLNTIMGGGGDHHTQLWEGAVITTLKKSSSILEIVSSSHRTMFDLPSKYYTSSAIFTSRKRKFGEGNVFTGVCLSTGLEGVGPTPPPDMGPGYHTPPHISCEYMTVIKPVE